MKLPALLASDLHLTANPNDEYRWHFFPWVATQCRRYHVKTLVLLGDMTDAKDYHSAELVNRVASCLDRVSDEVDEILILTGNHDYLKSGHAFFEFLNLHPKIRFITEPHESIYLVTHGNMKRKAEDLDALLLPHSKNPEKDWAKFNFAKYEMIFMHQTVGGALSSNGQAMRSTMPATFNLRKDQRLYSGDIHVPQVIGDVIYVGSPYPVHFGDTFDARCILLEVDGTTRDLKFYTVQRLILDLTLDTLWDWPDLYEKDQVKFRIHLKASECPKWDRIRREVLDKAKGMKLEVVSIQLKAGRERKRLTSRGEVVTTTVAPERNVERFVHRRELGGDLLDAALDVVEGNQ